MSSTLSVPVSIEVKVVVHEIKGGGFWGEVPLFPGCLCRRPPEKNSTLVSAKPSRTG